MTDIFVIDDKHPEDIAMLQALYSRSPASVTTHLEKLEASGSGKFMDQYYVGYGHASIGDCGTTTVFVEQVSMLVAKAIQDNPLYNGQEASTRYLDFSQQSVVDPYNSPSSKDIQSKWMSIYDWALPLLKESLEKRYPFDPSVYKTERIWKNAVHARAFDIARSLLPIGTTTLLSWTTSLRAARDHMRRLKHHPLPEIRDTAKSIFDALIKKYPHSFNVNDMDVCGCTRDVYAERNALRDNFVSTDDIVREFAPTPDELELISTGEVVSYANNVDLDGLNRDEADTLAMRPKNTALPRRLASYGAYNYIFLLDFGSFRDLQRHRNGLCQIPLIDGRFGMNPWYTQQFFELLSSGDSKKLEQDISAQFSAIEALPTKGVAATPLLNQYLYPMGTQALVHVNYSVPEVVYVGELRSAKTVHPSLRPVAQKMLESLQRDLPEIALYGDFDEDSWTEKRGEQTIGIKTA